MRKRRVAVYDNANANEGEGVEIGEGDRLRDVGWFISGRKGTVVIN